MRGKFLQGRPRMLTRDLFAVANLVTIAVWVMLKCSLLMVGFLGGGLRSLSATILALFYV